MSKLIIDSYGWIEFFMKGPKFKFFKERIFSSAEVLLPQIVLAEVAAKFRAAGRGEECRQVLASMVQRGQLIGISPAVADLAGKILVENKKFGMGLADASIIATALLENAKIVTGDEHFKRFDFAEVV
ncbi:MAG: type II toxin-antitoxin system VapC family toxin [Candidatus Micrarchaeia archaeon]